MNFSVSEQILIQVIRAAYLPTSVGSTLPTTPGIRWNEVAAKAQEHRLAPLLYAALKGRDLMSTLPEDVAQDLRAAYFRSNVVNWHVFEELGQLRNCFHREKLPVVLLKGCALAGTLYPDMTLRPMDDLDVLVPKEEVKHISNLLAERGYTPFIEPGDGFQQTLRNEQAFVREGQVPIAVDVHWHLMAGKYYSDRIPIDWFWSRTTVVTVADQSALVLLPEPQLLHLVTHLALHHSGEGLLWSFDIALLLDHYREQMKWGEVVQAAQLFGLAEILRTIVTEVCKVWGVNLPAEAYVLLDGIKPSLPTRLRSAIHNTRYAGARATWDALSTPGFRGKLTYLWLFTFPSEKYMRERYAISDTRLMPLFYLGRIVRGIAIFLRSLVSITASAISVFMHRRDASMGSRLEEPVGEQQPLRRTRPDERCVN